MATEELFLLGVLAAMVAGVTIVIMGLRQRSHQLEMAHRERMAMIERGLVPSPEMAGPVQPSPAGTVTFRDHRRGARSQSQMTFGIVLIGAGFAFMAVVGIAADTPAVAIGIGGAVVIFGAVMIVISQLARPAETMTTTLPRPYAPPMSSPPAAPPIPPDHHDRVS